MGACASSPSVTSIGGKGEGKGKGTAEASIGGRGASSAAPAVDSFRRPSSAMVIHTMAGDRQEFNQPIQAKLIISDNPQYFLCNSESMSIGTCLPSLADEEELQPGQIYFLIPLSRSQKPLSLPELCDLAIQASSALNR